MVNGAAVSGFVSARPGQQWEPADYRFNSAVLSSAGQDLGTHDPLNGGWKALQVALSTRGHEYG